MATATRGCLGVIRVQDLAVTTATVVLGGVQEWSLTEESEQIDASEIGTCSKAFVAGATTRSASVTGFFDSADAGQAAAIMAVGNVIDFEVHPSGTGGSSWVTTTGGATITNIERSGGNDSLVSFSATIQVNGDLTYTP